MADPGDSFLLREYAERQSEFAFSELVERHVNFVYSAAMRYVGNPADARDIAQAVFVILARKSAALCGRSTLTGWLYETTRLTARQLLRTRTRQLIREQEAYMQSTLDQSGDDPLWHQLAPHLEEAMSRLRAADRELLALRFYENKTGEEAALLLGIGAAAARKRTDRALEKLRQFFAKRGVSSTTAIIAGAISSNSVQAAPIGLAKTISIVALAKGTAASTSTLTLVRGALKIMAWTKTKTVIVGVTAALLAVGGSTAIVSAVVTAREKAALAAVQGSWEGIWNNGPNKLRLVFKIIQTTGVYLGTLDSIDQAMEVPIPKLSAHSHSIHMEAPAAAVDYQATLNSDRTAMTGRLRWFEYSALVILNRTNAPDTILTMTPEQYAPRPHSPLQGEWEGTLKVRKTSLRLDLRIAETAPGAFEAQVDSPDQDAMNMAVTSLTFQPPTVEFTMASIDSSFRGNINESDDELAGTWTEDGRNRIPLTFDRVQTNAQATVEVEKDYGQGGYYQIQGHWKGALHGTVEAWAGKTEVHVVFNIAQMPDGSYSATIDSPDQGATGIPASSADFTFPNVRLEWKQIGGVFTGKLENGRLSGTWNQGKVTVPIQLERAF